MYQRYWDAWEAAEKVAIYSDCRYCGAKYSMPCLTTSGKPARRTHDMRVRPFVWDRDSWPLIIHEEPELADLL